MQEKQVKRVCTVTDSGLTGKIRRKSISFFFFSAIG